MIVITYQSPNGAEMDLSPGQVTLLTSINRWPKDSWGQEYCRASHGEHAGHADYSDEALLELVGVDLGAPIDEVQKGTTYYRNRPDVKVPVGFSIKKGDTARRWNICNQDGKPVALLVDVRFSGRGAS